MIRIERSTDFFRNLLDGKDATSRFVRDFEAQENAAVEGTAARLASVAAAGEALLSETVYASVMRDYPDLEHRTLTLRGKEVPVEVRVLHAHAS